MSKRKRHKTSRGRRRKGWGCACIGIFAEALTVKNQRVKKKKERGCEKIWKGQVRVYKRNFRPVGEKEAKHFPVFTARAAEETYTERKKRGRKSKG